MSTPQSRPQSRRKHELFNSQYFPCSQKVPISNCPEMLELLNYSKMCWRMEAHPSYSWSCACKQGVASAKSDKSDLSANPSILSSWIYQHYRDIRALVQLGHNPATVLPTALIFSWTSSVEEISPGVLIWALIASWVTLPWVPRWLLGFLSVLNTPREFTFGELGKEGIKKKKNYMKECE